jgi:hypothetical protein
VWMHGGKRRRKGGEGMYVRGLRKRSKAQK